LKRDQKCVIVHRFGKARGGSVAAKLKEAHARTTGETRRANWRMSQAKGIRYGKEAGGVPSLGLSLFDRMFHES
jgi:hypothetical protein